MRAIGLMCAVLMGVLAIGGCGNKEQPFTEAGAASKYRDYVPPDAQVVAEGTGALRFTPTTNGTLYLLDLSDMRQVEKMMTPHVVVTGGPLPGPEITFDPATASITRPGKEPVKLTTITPGHKYQLRWAPSKPTPKVAI
jgi:hypothetical protein